MSFKKLLLLLGMLVLCGRFAHAQTETDQVIEQILESVAEDAGEDFDYTELAERLNYYLRNPININKATASQLKELVFLTPAQINNLLLHISENGPLLELVELQSIDGFNPEVVKRLLPFITISASNSLADANLKDFAAKGHNDLMLRYGRLIEKQQGFNTPDGPDKSHYLGSPERLLLRYRYSYGQNISASLTMDKDAGEAFFSGGQRYGFDFYSGNVFFRNVGKISKIAVGDYALQFGQGLTLWSGLSFGKGAAISTVPKQNIGLRPYSSTNESLFLRGLAATINLQKFNVTPFVSYRDLDASYTNPALITDETEVSSVSETGFHRTASEVSKKGSLSQMVYGMAVQYSEKRFNVGAIAYQTNFGHPFEPGNLPYNQYEFAGKSLTNTGVYYDYNWKNLYFFGEGAHSLDGGFAYLNGAIASLSPKASLVLLQRNYQNDYQSFFNQAIAESTNAVNEKGFYSGLILNPTSQIEISSYADFFRFPWLKFGVDAPSKGYEFFSQLTYSYKKKLKATLRYKFKNKQENDDLNNTINYLEDVEKTNYRAELSYKLNDSYQVRTRGEVSNYQKTETNEFGLLVYQDLIYNPPVSKFSGNMRLAYFNTPSFSSRIYAYENDVLLAIPFPGFRIRASDIT
jgi:hypothetical protein